MQIHKIMSEVTGKWAYLQPVLVGLFGGRHNGGLALPVPQQLQPAQRHKQMHTHAAEPLGNTHFTVPLMASWLPILCALSSPFPKQPASCFVCFCCD